jgi:hypothetical protein
MKTPPLFRRAAAKAAGPPLLVPMENDIAAAWCLGGEGMLDSWLVFVSSGQKHDALLKLSHFYAGNWESDRPRSYSSPPEETKSIFIRSRPQTAMCLHPALAKLQNRVMLVADGAGPVRSGEEELLVLAFERPHHSLLSAARMEDGSVFAQEYGGSRDLSLRFIFYQVVQFLADSQYCDGQRVCLHSIYLSKRSWVRIYPSLPSYKPLYSIPRVPAFRDTITARWVRGEVTNFEYLMALNRAAGRTAGDPAGHPIVPWVNDFSDGSLPRKGWRDLTRSFFRIRKGDKQLDYSYANTGHHIPEGLSELTYYIYMSRRVPLPTLRSCVRREFVPQQYPKSIADLYANCPDEAIPEFYSDPQVFKSIHIEKGMPDLKPPPWAESPEEFVKAHRDMLESEHVSCALHAWIDLNFGCNLSGKAAISCKNVPYRPPQEFMTLPSARGFVQLFRDPHPRRCVAAPSWQSSGGKHKRESSIDVEMGDETTDIAVTLQDYFRPESGGNEDGRIALQVAEARRFSSEANRKLCPHTPCIGAETCPSFASGLLLACMYAGEPLLSEDEGSQRQGRALQSLLLRRLADVARMDIPAIVKETVESLTGEGGATLTNLTQIGLFPFYFKSLYTCLGPLHLHACPVERLALAASSLSILGDMPFEGFLLALPHLLDALSDLPPPPDSDALAGGASTDWGACARHVSLIIGSISFRLGPHHATVLVLPHVAGLLERLGVCIRRDGLCNFSIALLQCKDMWEACVAAAGAGAFLYYIFPILLDWARGFSFQPGVEDASKAAAGIVQSHAVAVCAQLPLDHGVLAKYVLPAMMDCMIRMADPPGAMAASNLMLAISSASTPASATPLSTSIAVLTILRRLDSDIREGVLETHVLARLEKDASHALARRLRSRSPPDAGTLHACAEVARLMRGLLAWVNDDCVVRHFTPRLPPQPLGKGHLSSWALILALPAPGEGQSHSAQSEAAQLLAMSALRLFTIEGRAAEEAVLVAREFYESRLEKAVQAGSLAALSCTTELFSPLASLLGNFDLVPQSAASVISLESREGILHPPSPGLSDSVTPFDAPFPLSRKHATLQHETISAPGPICSSPHFDPLSVGAFWPVAYTMEQPVSRFSSKTSASVTSICCAGDRAMVAGSAVGEVRVFSVGGKKMSLVEEYKGHSPHPVVEICSMGRGAQVASLASALDVWDVECGGKLLVRANSPSPLTSFIVRPPASGITDVGSGGGWADQQILATCKDGVLVYDVRAGRSSSSLLSPILRWQCVSSPLAICLTWDMLHVATYSPASGRVYMFDLRCVGGSRQPLKCWQAHAPSPIQMGQVSEACKLFSLAGGRILSCTSTSARLFSEGGQCLAEVKGPSASAYALHQPTLVGSGAVLCWASGEKLATVQWPTGGSAVPPMWHQLRGEGASRLGITSLLTLPLRRHLIVGTADGYLRTLA